MMKLGDDVIRHALVRRIRSQFRKEDYAIAHEFPVGWGARRADIVVANGSLHGYEIKSEKDSLARLDGQLRLYLDFFETVTVVCVRRFESAVIDFDPSVGVTTVVKEGRKFCFTDVREPAPKFLSAEHYVSLLHVDELASFVRELGRFKRGMGRWTLEEIAINSGLLEVRRFALGALKRRFSRQPN